MATLPYTYEQVKKALGNQVITPWHDANDNEYTSSSKQSVTGGTTYDFEDNGLAYEVMNFPSHITRMWDKTNNKIVVDEFQDSPAIVARVRFMFEPTSSAAGTIDVTIEPDNVSPEFSNTITVPFKSEATQVEGLFTFYVGTQAAANGLVIKYSPSLGGKVWDRRIWIYRT